jgi:hypothetical protein
VIKKALDNQCLIKDYLPFESGVGKDFKRKRKTLKGNAHYQLLYLRENYILKKRASNK